MSENVEFYELRFKHKIYVILMAVHIVKINRACTSYIVSSTVFAINYRRINKNGKFVIMLYIRTGFQVICFWCICSLGFSLPSREPANSAVAG